MMANLSASASAIACEALGIKPDGIPAKTAGRCAYCGAPIAAGELCVPFAPSGAFTNGPDLAARGSRICCPPCGYVVTTPGLMATQRGVFSRAGVQPFSKWADMRSALLDPPDPPFIMVSATRKNQHMVWRAPVNLSREQFYVRVGDMDLLVQPARLNRLVACCAIVKGVMERAKQQTKPTSKTKPEKASTMLPHPFVGFSTDVKEPVVGLLALDFAKLDALDESSEYQAALTALQTMTTGECWALTFALSTKA